MQTKVIRWFCRLAVDTVCPWAEAGGWGCPLSPCVTLVGAKRRELCSCSAAFDGAAASDRVFGVAMRAVFKRTRSEQVSFPLSLCYVNAHLHHVSLFPLSGSGVWALRSVGLGPAPLEPQPRVLARARRPQAPCEKPPSAPRSGRASCATPCTRLGGNRGHPGLNCRWRIPKASP